MSERAPRYLPSHIIDEHHDGEIGLIEAEDDDQAEHSSVVIIGEENSANSYEEQTEIDDYEIGVDQSIDFSLNEAKFSNDQPNTPELFPENGPSFSEEKVQIPEPENEKEEKKYVSEQRYTLEGGNLWFTYTDKDGNERRDNLRSVLTDEALEQYEQLTEAIERGDTSHFMRTRSEFHDTETGYGYHNADVVINRDEEGNVVDIIFNDWYDTEPKEIIEKLPLLPESGLSNEELDWDNRDLNEEPHVLSVPSPKPERSVSLLDIMASPPKSVAAPSEVMPLPEMALLASDVKNEPTPPVTSETVHDPSATLKSLAVHKSINPGNNSSRDQSRNSITSQSSLSSRESDDISLPNTEMTAYSPPELPSGFEPIIELTPVSKQSEIENNRQEPAKSSRQEVLAGGNEPKPVEPIVDAATEKISYPPNVKEVVNQTPSSQSIPPMPPLPQGGGMGTTHSVSNQEMLVTPPPSKLPSEHRSVKALIIQNDIKKQTKEIPVIAEALAEAASVEIKQEYIIPQADSVTKIAETTLRPDLKVSESINEVKTKKNEVITIPVLQNKTHARLQTPTEIGPIITPLSFAETQSFEAHNLEQTVQLTLEEKKTEKTNLVIETKPTTEGDQVASIENTPVIESIKSDEQTVADWQADFATSRSLNKEEIQQSIPQSELLTGTSQDNPQSTLTDDIHIVTLPVGRRSRNRRPQVRISRRNV